MSIPIKNDLMIPYANRVLYELPTGRGKTRASLLYLQSKNVHKPLVVLPRKLLERNWINEIKKWNMNDVIQPIFIQYASFINPQKWKNLDFDSIIFDEAHHITERCAQALNENKSVWISKVICMLSATISYEQRQLLKYVFHPFFTVWDSMQNAIKDNALPKPTIIMWELTMSDKNRAIYQKIEHEINVIKVKAQSYINYEKLHLLKCKQRNIWLSKQKTIYIKDLLKILSTHNKYRTLTFCADIQHCEDILPNSNITSKNKTSKSILEAFNDKQINHISACNMLDEGQNLVDCQIGIFAYLTISKKLTVQRIGRILRHPNPIIILPYYKDTRDYEIICSLYKQLKDVSNIYRYNGFLDIFNLLIK